MREPWLWEEEDVLGLIREQRKENLQFEYKKSDALAKTDGKKTEITKDVSAMANSAGEVIVYGIDEQRKSNGPIQLDIGIDPTEISTEWLEQVIDSGIQRRIDGIKVHP
jgi:predicted HTH transcriptional regulator